MRTNQHFVARVVVQINDVPEHRHAQVLAAVRRAGGAAWRLVLDEADTDQLVKLRELPRESADDDDPELD